MDRPERKVLWLPAAEIRPNPMQPRRTFEETGLRELAESIRRHGILQPLTVRRTAAGWELVAGERRLRAAVLAGLETVPCLEAEVDGRASALLALVENLQRKDLHYLEEAEAIAAFLHQTGMTQEAVAAQLGMSPSALAKKVKAGELQPEDITEEMMSDAMYTTGQKDPDFILRPSGEKRLSNFMLWQAAYSELVEMDVLWPDFTRDDLDAAITEFNKRSRRFGGI